MLATGETKAIAIVSNTDWTVASNQTWLKVSPHKGNKNGSVNVTAEANTSLAAREAEITIVAENLTHRIAVTQAAGAATLTVTPATLSFVAAGEGKTLAVKSNTSWTAESNQSWLSLSATSGSGDQNLTASASANTTVAQRTATITLKVGSSLVKTVSVTQAAGAATLTVDSPANFTVAATGDTKTINISSNASWTAESTAPWLKLSPASGNGDGKLTVTAEANTENKVRTATVTIVVGGIRKEITVKQDAATSAADFEALGLRLWSSQGVLFIQSDSVIGEAEVFHLSGLLVTSLKLSEGITQIALPKGLYVVRFNNKLAKVMVQ